MEEDVTSWYKLKESWSGYVKIRQTWFQNKKCWRQKWSFYNSEGVNYSREHYNPKYAFNYRATNSYNKNWWDYNEKKTSYSTTGVKDFDTPL